MEQAVRLIVSRPDRLHSDQVAGFTAFVLAGGEVAEGLPALVGRAPLLALLYEDETLIGTAGLKVPNAGYHARVFEKAGGAPLHADYPHELGWVRVAPHRQGQRHASRLIDGILDGAGKGGIYATTRADNDTMHHALSRRGFVQSGEAYKSTRRPGEMIVLLVRAERSEES